MAKFVPLPRDIATQFLDPPTLRLQVLKDELEPIAAELWTPGKFIELELEYLDRPRLWLDLVSSVAMAPDLHTYRLTQDTDDGEHVLFEMKDRAQMVERIRQYMAHGVSTRTDHTTSNRSLPLHTRYAMAIALIAGFL